MAMKTIKTNVTLHQPGEKHAPYEWADGSRKSGTYDVKALPPGTLVTLDEKEADAILKRFGGTIVTGDGDQAVDPARLPAPKVTSDPGKPLAPKP